MADPSGRAVSSESTAARLLGLRVRVPLGAWMSVSYECCVLSGRGLCDGPIFHPEEIYRLWCVIVCDLETWNMRRPWPALGCCVRNKQTRNYVYICVCFVTICMFLIAPVLRPPKTSYALSWCTKCHRDLRSISIRVPRFLPVSCHAASGAKWLSFLCHRHGVVAILTGTINRPVVYDWQLTI